MQNFSANLCLLLQQEYIRGISAWNFNLEDLKNQAALVCICHGQVENAFYSYSQDNCSYECFL